MGAENGKSEGRDREMLPSGPEDAFRQDRRKAKQRHPPGEWRCREIIALELFSGLSLFARFLPTGYAGGEVLDVGVAEFLGLGGCSLVGGAGRATAIRYHE